MERQLYKYFEINIKRQPPTQLSQSQSVWFRGTGSSSHRHCGSDHCVNLNTLSSSTYSALCEPVRVNIDCINYFRNKK